MSLTESIKKKVVGLGFDLVGITTADAIGAEQIEYFSRGLEQGHAGQMGYMKSNIDKRTNPARLLEGSRSVICVGLNYKPDDGLSSRSVKNGEGFGRVANFALYEDYHRFMKERLYLLADFISDAVGRDEG